MKKTSKLKFAAILVLAIATLFILKASPSFAATRTWTGGGGNNNLATAGNWQGGVAPADGDTLLFDATNNTISVNNNLASSISINGITVTGGGYVQISGALLKLEGAIGGMIFKNPIEAVGNITSTSDFVSFEQPISGTGNITLNYSGSSYAALYMYANSPSYTGQVSATKTNICLKAVSGVLGTTAAASSFTDGYLNIVDFDSSATIAENLTLNNIQIGTFPGLCGLGGGGTATKSPHTITLSGTIAASNGVEFNGVADLVLSGSVTGEVSLMPGTIASLTVNGTTRQPEEITRTIANSSECGSDSLYAINLNNRLVLNTECSFEVQVAGVLLGTGKMGGVLINDGGMIAPGNSPGTISTGNLVFEEGGIYEFEVVGNESGQYDQINVTGTVALGNGTLRTVLLDGFKPSQGKTFTIINNDGSDQVEGTFAGLAEGAPVEVDGTAYFTISYIGGDGNDVVLTAIPGVGETGIDKSGRSYLIILASVLGLGVVYIKGRKFIAARR